MQAGLVAQLPNVHLQRGKPGWRKFQVVLAEFAVEIYHGNRESVVGDRLKERGGLFLATGRLPFHFIVSCITRTQFL